MLHQHLHRASALTTVRTKDVMLRSSVDGGISKATAQASAGCATIAAADGVSYTCSCDHLTDFIVFEFPTTAEELFEDITQAVTVHQITARAFECLRRPSFTTHPVIWGINVGLLVLFGLGLGNAIRRDRKEIAFVEKLMEGRKKDALRRGRMRIAQLLKQNANSTRSAKGVLTGESAAMAPLRRLRMSSRAASMFAGSRPVTTNATEGAPASQGLQRYTRAGSLFIPSRKGKDFDALGGAAAAPHRLTVGGKKCDPAVGTPRRVSVIEDEKRLHRWLQLHLSMRIFDKSDVRSKRRCSIEYRSADEGG